VSTLLPGTEVQARGLRWEVIIADQLGQQTLYRLRCIDGGLRGREVDLLHPFETIEPIVRDLRPERAAPLRHWLVYHQAFLLEQALGPDALLAVQPGRLRLEPYQLVPVVRALRMSRVRLLLADSVGLGKTVQAGLILTELIARRLAHRILVVTPAGPLLDQWRTELAERFGLRMHTVDRAALDEVRRSTESGANPFDHIPLGLASIDFLKQDHIVDLLDRASYDVVVIDEAHHCMDVSGGDREDSQRRRLADVLARRCDALLLLTATPHDGNDRSFASLCALLDPSLVDHTGDLRGDRYRAHVIRRLKRHIVDPATGKQRFRERVVLPVPVTAEPGRHDSFIALQRALINLIAPQLRRAFRTRSYSDVLSLLALLKRSVSTVAACRETLTAIGDRRQEIVRGIAESQESRRQRRNALRDIQRRLERFGALGVEEELVQHQLQAEDLVHMLVDVQREIRVDDPRQRREAELVDHLGELSDLAAAALAHDPKLDRLVAELQAIRAEEPQANILVYTEYIDSQRAAVDALQRAGLGPVLTMSGEHNDATRSVTTNRFRTADGLVLISTDAAAEGLNLHYRCHHLFHLELPFNPNRLEQRNGRIDRFGQEHDPVVRYFYLRGTFEERILLRLIAKYERQRTRLTFVPNTLGLVASTPGDQARLLQGLLDEDERLFEDTPALTVIDEAADSNDLDPARRELLDEIDRSLRSFEQAARTHVWLGDVGLAADTRSLESAGAARERGRSAGIADLASFVFDAVRIDGGDVRPGVDPRVQEVALPSSWAHGLADLPGYDSDTLVARLTTELDLTHDALGRPVGYLGRAHPLVRRALDRVRNLSFGKAAEIGQDLRASAAIANVAEPTLLFTFLGRIESKAGRELEQVLAVRVTPGGYHILLASPADWLPLVEAAKPIRTTGVYEQHFAAWYAEAGAQAYAAAEQGFCHGSEVSTFVAARRRDLGAERGRLDDWLYQLAETIAPRGVASALQLDLFAQSADRVPRTTRPWQEIIEPRERLAAFHLDRSAPPRLRGDAEHALRIFTQRSNDLDACLAMRAPELLSLGVLMLLPSNSA